MSISQKNVSIYRDQKEMSAVRHANQEKALFFTKGYLRPIELFSLKH